jgi:glycosyltransferase involved in cell wall biosynthesis
MSKPNVLFISSWYPNNEHSTLGNFVQKHAHSVKDLVNLRVLTVTASPNINKNFELVNRTENGIDTTIVYYKKITSKIPLFSSIFKYFKHLKAYKLGLEYIQKQTSFNQINLTHCNITYQASIFARYLKNKYGIPYIITEHATLYSSLNNQFQQLNTLQKYLIKKGIKQADIITVVSEHLKNSMLGKGLINTYEIVPNVVNAELFHPSQKAYKSKGKAEILHISHMDLKQKNASEMLKVIKAVALKRQDFVLRLITDDNFEQTRALIQAYGLEDFVIMETTKSTKEIAKAMQNASFFLLYSNVETFSVVLAEAWCSGLPAVYSKCGGLTDIYNPILGLQVEKQNNKALELAIIQMLETYQNYNSEQISNFVKTKFDEPIIGQQFLKIYKSVLR